MGQILLSNSPIALVGTHNDKIDHQVIDEFGTHDVYIISSLMWQELVGSSWNILIEDSNGKLFPYVVNPYEEGSYNIPTPQRFYSYPLTQKFTISR